MAANKIKNKYKKKILGKKKFEKDSVNDKRKKTSTDWLKTAGYLDTMDQDAMNYIFVPPKKAEENKIPSNAGHCIKSEIDATDLVPNIVLEELSNNEELDRIDTIETLDDIATLQPGKSAQLAAKR